MELPCIYVSTLPFHLNEPYKSVWNTLTTYNFINWIPNSLEMAVSKLQSNAIKVDNVLIYHGVWIKMRNITCSTIETSVYLLTSYCAYDYECTFC